MWKVIYMTDTRTDAESIEKVLSNNNFLVKIRAINKKNAQGLCEILVPQTEAEDAYMILVQHNL